MAPKIPEIYNRYLAGTISRVELDVLLRFFEEASEQDLKSLLETGFQKEENTAIDADTQARLERVQGNLIDHTFKRPIRALWPKQWLRVAAAVLLLLLGTYAAFEMRNTDKAADLYATQPRLLVENNSGKKIAINPISDSVWTSDDVIFTMLDSQTVRLVSKDGTLQPSKQTLSTDRSDFKILLEDGTTVTLNAHSSLTLHVPFAKSQRQVDLKGEGYFEVSHDPNRPFTVSAGSTSIEVLGTRFNVRNYPEETAVETSLLQGKIALSQRGSAGRLILSPGQKAISDKQGIKLLAQQSLKASVAWKERYFDYEDQSLQRVLQDVSRWYGTDLDTTSIPKDKKIYMKIHKNLPLSEVLQLLGETSNLTYRFKSGQIQVYKPTSASN